MLGGISEALELAAGLSEKGFEVLVSRATRIVQIEPVLSGVSYRHGRLDKDGLVQLAGKENIVAMIDCTHPYASEISWNGFRAAQDLGLPFFVYDRPGLDPAYPGILRARDHFHAADLAFNGKGVVFLSIGSKNIQIYSKRAGQRISSLAARVLPGQEILHGCLDAGLCFSMIIQARGSFSVEENLTHLKMVKAECLVTKDSGFAGGVPAKFEAASQLGIRVIVVERPSRPGRLRFKSIDKLLACLSSTFFKDLAGFADPPESCPGHGCV